MKRIFFICSFFLSFLILQGQSYQSFGFEPNNSEGKVVAISADGSTLAIGKEGIVKVYTNNNGNWIPKGETFTGSGNTFGDALSLSNDGNILAIGEHYGLDPEFNSPGLVKIYSWNGTNWTQIGGTLYGVNSYEEFGYSVSLSSDGTRIAIGAPSARGNNNTQTGMVQIYTYNADDGGYYNFEGAYLYGFYGEEWNGDDFGAAVSISSDGNYLVVGAPSGKGSGDINPGYVNTYSWDGTTWTQTGNTLYGTASWDYFGQSVSISGSGNKIAVGAPFANSRKGEVKVFETATGNQTGSAISGTVTGDHVGSSVALSFSGDRLAVGATQDNVEGQTNNSGEVKIYGLNNSNWELIGNPLYGHTVAGSGFGYSISLDAFGGIVAIGSERSHEVRIYGFSCGTPNWVWSSTLPEEELTLTYAQACNLEAQSLDFSNQLSGSCLFEASLGETRTNNFTECGGTISRVWLHDDNGDGVGELRHEQQITVLAAEFSFDWTPTNGNITYEEACAITEDSFDDLNYSINQACTAVSGKVEPIITSDYDACSGGTITAKWLYDYGCDSIKYTQTLTVAPELNPSWLSLPDIPESLTANKADSFSIPSMTISNGISSGDCNRSDQVSGSPTNEYDNAGGIKILNWSNTDECGRSLIHKDTIQVTRIPNANWTSTLPQNTSISYAEAQASVKFPDLNYSNGLEGDHKIAGAASAQVNSSYTQCAGGFLTLTWSFVDPIENTLTSHTQTITVLPDTEASWTWTPANITLKPDEVGAFLDTFTVRDLSYANPGGTIIGTATGVSSGSLEGCGSSMSVYWTFTDICGRKKEYTQTIAVESAANMPVWNNPPGNLTYSIAQAAAFQPVSLSYSNNDQANPIEGTADPVISGSFNACGGSIVVNWSFTDPCGRLLTHTQTITVVPAPQAQFVNAPSNQTLSLAQANSYSAPALVCTNGMSGTSNITATVAASVQRNYSTCGGNMVVRWSYTDGCGRTTRYEQTITVQAVPQAVFLNPPGDITLTCPAYQDYVSPVLLLSNNQSGNNLISGAVAAQVTAGSEVCGSGFTETWSYTDVCGRTTTHSRLVTVTATCDDGIQNQGEEDIDCGGPCKSCATCDDGIQNQDEAGIDCGGPCSPCPVCLEPVNQQSVRTGTNRVALSWEGVANASKYVLQIRVSGSDKWYVFETTSTSLTIRGLSSNTDYEWQVYSDCEVIESPWSALCSFNASDEEPRSCSDSVRPPSCEDGIQNQGEEETDCGGPCTACLRCDVPDNLFADGINADSARLQWSAIPDAGSYRVRVKMRDSLDWRTYSTANTYLVISDLSPDVEYDWQVKSDCSAKESDWSEMCGFIANDPASGDCAAEEAPDPTCFDGKQNQGEAGIDCGGPCYLCPGCYVPTGMYVDNIANRRATLNWTGTEWDSVFQVRIRELGSETWYSFRTENTSLTIRGLSRATDYEWQVQSGCGELGESGWSDACSFNSDEPNSGSCGGSEQPEETLCEVSSPENLYAEVFMDQTALLHWDTVANAEWYTLRVKRSETEWEHYETGQNSYALEGLIPYAAYEWQVSAACTESVSEWSSSCGFIANDEESGNCAQESAPSCEDGLQNQGEEGIDCGGPCEACVSEDNCPAPGDLGAEIRQIGRIYLVRLVWSASEALEYELRVRAVGTSTWTTYRTRRTSYQLARLPADQVYEWQLRSICGEEAGSWSAESTFTLGNPSLSGLVPGSGQATGIRIYPNPLKDRMMLLLERPLEKAERVRLLNVFGQEVWSAVLSEGQSRHEFDLSEVPAGLYLLDAGQNELLKIVIQ